MVHGAAGALLHWLHFLPHYKTVPEPPALDRTDNMLRRRDTLEESALQIASYNTRVERQVGDQEGAMGGSMNGGACRGGSRVTGVTGQAAPVVGVSLIQVNTCKRGHLGVVTHQALHNSAYALPLSSFPAAAPHLPGVTQPTRSKGSRTPWMACCTT